MGGIGKGGGREQGIVMDGREGEVYLCICVLIRRQGDSD